MVEMEEVSRSRCAAVLKCLSSRDKNGGEGQKV
jgi:hypothetical protein